MRQRLGGIHRELQRRRLRRKLAGQRLLRAFANVHPEAFFVEIGANDGAQHDHLRPFILECAWSGIMVEPVPYVFERLRRNYPGLDRVLLENSAVADRDGELPFYYLIEPRPEDLDRLPAWYDGIGSFSRDAVLSHVAHIPDIEERIVCKPVKSLTFESLCRKHDVENVDLLAIDTEGYDHVILRSIDFSARKPELLVYEHFHLDPEVRGQCRALVEAAGYRTLEEGFDTWCLSTDADTRLLEMFESVKPAVAGVAAYEQ
jgi:FkbM family methyltransferase